MKNIINATIYLVFVFCFFSAEAQKDANENNLIIEFKTDAEKFVNDSIILSYIVADNKPGLSRRRLGKKNESDITRWTFYIPRAVTVSLTGFINTEGLSFCAEPGDSIRVTKNGKELVLSGKGSEKKSLLDSIEILKKSISKPAGNQFKTVSLDDFLQWNAYKNKQLEVCVSYIESNKSRLSEFLYNYLKFKTIGRIEEDRLDKFNYLQAYATKLDLTSQNLCNIFDSSFYGRYAVWMRSMPFYHSSYFAFNRHQALRKHEYNHYADSVDVEEKQLYFRCNLAKQSYKGEVLEKLLVDLLTRFGVNEVGLKNENVQKLLADYYNEPGFPEYKAYVKEYVQHKRELKLAKGKPVPDFSLKDINEKVFTRELLKNKVVLMDFWFTGCLGCVQMAPALRKVEGEFKNNPNVVFLSVNVDKEKDKWIKSIAQKKYTTGKGLNLYTGGLGREHEIVNTFNISGYPTLYLLGPYGRIAESQVPDPRKDNGALLIKLIQQQLAGLADGPYVIYENDSLKVHHIDGGAVKTESVKCVNTKKITIPNSMIDENFKITLKKELKNEPSQFAKPSRFFVLSDIEGNFMSLKDMLTANSIIDSTYNWTFRDGHLVIVGDVFDRGEQVTECLWLIYSLEEKAKAAGGYVHFILGNHEIMNLSGDLRYVHPKYKGISTLIGKEYTDIYSKDSELGRWLRTKNIIEKIGDILFVHAGISEEVIELSLTTEQINRLARPYYDKFDLASKSSNKSLQVLYDSKHSPFWHRLYYQEEEIVVNYRGDTSVRTPMRIIDNTLAKFDVKQIVTGHTIVADSISVHFGGKVINTDTKHAEGKSEALLIVGNEYFRVNNRSDRMPLNLGDNNFDITDRRRR